MTKIIYDASTPLYAVLKSLPVDTPRLLIASALDDLTAAGCLLGEEPAQYVRRGMGFTPSEWRARQEGAT